VLNSITTQPCPGTPAAASPYAAVSYSWNPGCCSSLHSRVPEPRLLLQPTQPCPGTQLLLHPIHRQRCRPGAEFHHHAAESQNPGCCSSLHSRVPEPSCCSTLQDPKLLLHHTGSQAAAPPYAAESRNPGCCSSLLDPRLLLHSTGSQAAAPLYRIPSCCSTLLDPRLLLHHTGSQTAAPLYWIPNCCSTLRSRVPEPRLLLHPTQPSPGTQAAAPPYAAVSRNPGCCSSLLLRLLEVLHASPPQLVLR